jgi:DNA mismatch repair protein MutL
MAKIRVLPDHVANQIAAGEVVERPASVLKELIENSLDAGAARIEVRWEEGGKRLLEVADDGCGMGRDDLYLALERHATSKVRTADDLGHLSSFGFRGEALPSVASVTRLDLQSAEAEGAGHVLRCEFGIVKDVRPSPRTRGTTVTVRDLFAQLPARRRFLKSSDTEHAHLWGVVSRMALATPGIRWRIATDRGGELVLPPVRDPSERLGPLLGDAFSALQAFRDGEPPWQIRGYLSPPELSFRDRNHLYLFVNGRSVRDRLLLAALSGGWEGFFPKGAYPAVVLFLDIPPASVDVNVHPTKAEVRFQEPNRVFPWVGRAVREAWTALRGELPSLLQLPPRPLEPEFELPVGSAAAGHASLWAGAPEGADARVADRGSASWGVDGPGPDPAGGSAAGRPAYGATGPAPGPSPGALPGASSGALPGASSGVASGAASGAAPLAGLRYLGSFDATYLLAEVPGVREPELWIVDQHVAHERILYERLFLQHHRPAVQPLLPPQAVRLGPMEVSRLTPFLEEINGVGLEVEAFGADTLVVRGLPDFLTDRDPRALLEDLLLRLESAGSLDLDFFRRELNAELACRGAIKKHHPLGPELAHRLIQDLMACQVPHTCPHGRPVIKKLTRADLERTFGRRA